MTTPIRLPLHHWPLGWQCGLALAAVVAVGLGARAWVRVSGAGVLALQRTLTHDTRTLDTRTPESTRLAGARWPVGAQCVAMVPSVRYYFNS